MSLPRYLKYKHSGVARLGEVPEHWRVERLKYCFRLMTDKAEQREHAVALENVESWSGRFKETDGTFEGEGVGFRSGDLLFGKLRPYLAKAYLADRDGEAVGDFHVLRPHPHVNPRFAQYQVLTRQFIDEVDGSTFGSKMPRASWECLGGMPFVLPPSSECVAVVSFLDRETSKIDTLVAEQRRLVKLMKEKRQAVISHAVTKGLHPDAAMKPTGVEWLGAIPLHWASTRLGKVCQRIADGPHFSPQYVDEGVPFLSARNVKIDGWSLDDVKFVSEQDCDEFDRRIVPLVGDVLYTKGGTTGIAKVVDLSERFQVWVHIAVLKIRPDLVDPYYLAYALNAHGSYEQAQLLTRGATNNDLGLTRMTGIWIALPPLEEQRSLAAFLLSQTKQLDLLASEAERAIAVLEERRSAIVTAAVTGQIDVRDSVSGANS